MYNHIIGLLLLNISLQVSTLVMFYLLIRALKNYTDVVGNIKDDPADYWKKGTQDEEEKFE